MRSGRLRTDRLVRHVGNLIVLALWAIWLLLLWYVSSSVSDMKPFDPFEILEIDRSATDREIKKAYRQLSLRFHPDKVCIVCCCFSRSHAHANSGRMCGICLT